MRVFIAGATGVLGRRLVRQFAERGHAAVGLVRGEEGRRLVESLGGEARTGDLFDADSLAAAAAGAQVVVHAATAIPTRPRTLPRDWETNDRIRREGTRALGRGLAARKIPIIGKGDAVWAALHADDAAGAFLAAAESGKGGLWHVTDDEPVTVGELLGEFARLLGAGPPRRAPAWLARLLAGRDAVEFFTKSTRTSNARPRRDIGWKPRYRDHNRAVLEVYAYPHFGDHPVAAVGTAEVMAALEPIWRTKVETATRLRGRIEAVLDYAASLG